MNLSNPVRNVLDRMPKAWKAALGGLAGALALSCCADRVAGTSVGTGNPTEIEVAFKDDSGEPISITGDLSVYASTQIPVEGYAPEPLVKLAVAGADRATLKAEDFQALADTLWPKGSRDGAVYSFNVVVTGESRGAIVRGLTWRKDLNKFVLRDEDPKMDEGMMKASIEGPLIPLVAFQGIVDTSNFSKYMNYHLFIYGTGYAAKVENGSFRMPALPKNEYEGFLLALPKPNQPASGDDSTSVFSLTTPLGMGNLSLAKGEVHDRVVLPDSLLLP